MIGRDKNAGQQYRWMPIVHKKGVTLPQLSLEGPKALTVRAEESLA